MLKRKIAWITANKKPVLFIVKIVSLYLILQGVYDFLISPYTSVDKAIIDSIISSCETILQYLGFALIESNSIYPNHLGILGTSGVIIGAPCDGLSLFILFSSFILVFEGKWPFKLVYIFIGSLLIHFLNIIRVLGLSLIVKFYPETLDFHHSYTFTLIIYVIIFLFWYLRLKIYNLKSW